MKASTANTNIRRARSGAKRSPLGLRLVLALAAVGAAALAWGVPALAEGGNAPGAAPAAEHTAPAEPGHVEAAHAEGAGGEAGKEHGEEKEEVSIHLGTWLTGPLKVFWRSGPAILSASGVIGAKPDELKGKAVDFKFEDHHAQIHPKPVYDIHPTIGEIGASTSASGAKTETVTVDGRNVTLINPEVKFAWEGMFPEALVISILTMLTIAAVLVMLTRKLTRIPDRKQSFLEILYTGLDAFLYGLIGEGHRQHTWLLITAFIYILCMNLAGLIPGWASPTANMNITAGMALVVVVYSHYVGLKQNGIKGYLMHFVGDPWWLGPLNFPLHIIGEVAKVLSLTIRLFGNMFGEDVVIVILILLAGMFTKGFAPVPLVMYFLGVFTSVVQALVFTILSSVYIALMSAHHDEGHGNEGHAHDHGDSGHGHSHDVAAHAAA